MMVDYISLKEKTKNSRDGYDSRMKKIVVS